MQRIAQSPTGEINYYLFILARSIQDKYNEKNRLFLSALLDFINTLDQFYSSNPNDPPTDCADQLIKNYEKLLDSAETHTFSAITKRALIQLGALIMAFLLSLLGATIGSMAGFARGIWQHQPLTGFLVGLLIGFFIGGILGFRLPKKLMKDVVNRQLTFGLDGLKHCVDQLKEKTPIHSPSGQSANPLPSYYTVTEEKIKQQFATEEECNTFLSAEIGYEINSYHASFIANPMLHRYLGHHVYIKMFINEKPYLIEFTPAPSDLSTKSVQNEKRAATGRKLIEMLAYHQKLQETHHASIDVIAKKIKPGDNDCLSYVNKVLIGSSQKATQLQRFYDMTRVGSGIGFFIEKLSPFPPTFFNASEIDGVVPYSSSQLKVPPA